MFEQTFKDVLFNLSSDQAVIDTLLKEIKTNYSSKARHYHTMAHLDHLIGELDQIKKQIKDWQTIIFSVAYHDIVYNPIKKDNEERSAAIAMVRLSELNRPERQKEKCRQQILSTKTHLTGDDPDTNYLTDADLSILGSDPESYLAYCRQVRKEYKYFPDLLYKPGRKKVLMRFLEMTHIFKTKYFREKYEAKARLNITNEIKSLS